MSVDMLRKICYTIWVAVMLIVLIGCDVRKEIQQPLPNVIPEQTQEINADNEDEETQETRFRNFMPYIYDKRRINGVDVIFPIARGKFDSTLNEIIMSEIDGIIQRNGKDIDIDYEVTFNDKGIFSVVLTAYEEDILKTAEKVPINFDCNKGKIIKICDYFKGDNENWRYVLPDVITAQADRAGLTLLSDVLPISDEQYFYITEDSIVLVYRNYEITTYTGNVPEFMIPLNQLNYLINE